MPVTCTISGQNPAEDEPRAELDDVVRAVFSPTDPTGNPITAIAATIDGVSKTVTTVTLAGGVKSCSFPATFILERTHSVAWDVTTSDANVNPFAYTFTVRDADWDVELVSVLADIGAWSPEYLGAVVTEREGGHAERIDFVALTNLTSQAEAVDVTVLEGLGAGYFSTERVEVIVASLEEIPSAMPLSISAAPGDSAPLALSIVVASEREHNRHALSVNVFSEERTPALPLSIQVSDPGRSTLPLSIQAGEGDESRLALSTEIEGATAAPVPLELRLTNEALATEES